MAARSHAAIAAYRVVANGRRLIGRNHHRADVIGIERARVVERQRSRHDISNACGRITREEFGLRM